VTASTAVIVPVLGRPQNAAPFMESLSATTTPYAVAVYVITNSGAEDERVAWRDAGADFIIGSPRSTFACKVNDGYVRSHEPWLFIVGDDVKFHADWLEKAQQAAGDVFHVVGTNDLGNARVMRGEHGTHLLIRRSYVKEVGAGWDGPGVVAHEGYHHWYVDDEIVSAAKQRGVWTSAPTSVVEHLHPYWGKAETDDTYRLGEAHAQEDKARFRSRAMRHLRGVS
jgi:hypothetical protein